VKFFNGLFTFSLPEADKVCNAEYFAASNGPGGTEKEFIPMSKNRFQFGRTALICLLPAALLAGCGAKAAQPTLDPTVTVETEIAALDTLTLEQTYMATVSADSSASVYPKVNAIVSSLNVEVGDTVNAGDVLCRFEDSNSVGVSQAQAQLNYKELADSKHPKAKISGTISDVYVHNGDAVSAGSPIARIIASNDISVDFLFPYASPDKFYVGQSATVFITGFAGSYQGSVSSVPDSTATTSNGMNACTVRVTMKNPGNLTDSGSYTASAVIGSYTSYGQASLHMTGADTVYAKASGTISGFNKVSSSTVSAGEALCTIVSDALDAQIRNAQLSLQSAGNAMDNFTLTAPISGTVEAVNISENNMASPSAPAFLISADGEKTAVFYVTDDVAKEMQMGQAVTVTSQGQEYHGTVSQVGLAVDAATGLFKMEAVLQDALDLPNGKTVELTTTAYSQSNAILVPSDALYFESGDSSYVYVVEDGTAVRRNVTVGLYDNETTAITGGLDVGEEVITTWSAGLRDGVPVRVADAAAEAGDTADTADTGKTAQEADAQA